ncbi:hypothetical protein A2643_02060 [Candidatus Nomurabacteria bacterium RIFCSPHIGHO2_01_FULL_39_220]|uniref:Type IV pilus assembly protein PilO n=1 Tax=Candidatus Nomurabacteria bacterium RIFCSPLOWO2_02_FULL_40_67 TaxID=1801787 RepID=A0A1F6Y502_9BACT|nr:MAG: hypothetical protein UU01_C0010G0005 [Parcubacteria group bacterium GW2011_GWA2_40_37]KKS14220.1 MAG: hypothetical protein UU71_C0031G0005 [Parcubacteria group bacterium GW2011_GWB1_41_6]KKS72405.1 MAG: hypothetical protein UV43_C0017G0005 [Parcubacteria group bacterium GW2011_GWF2_42_7]OGI63136.1 MAG: hypothetical protein A2W12_04165 [Candidatus Nomurabacteria bacterium RBG_16_40_11]OGI69882.1 MAG: hypothetical protein A2643_02060 [Candidatus Nomurabacteria bacterium RIFCSPHIGHO2_01_FU
MQKSFQKIPLLLSLIFFLASIFSFLYLYQEIKNNSWEIDKKENEWRIEAIRREELKTLNNSIEAIKEERQQLETHFARSSDVVLFLNTVEGLAKGAGIEKEVRSVDISKDKKALMVAMEAKGSFPDLYKFLTLLENSPYELELIEVKFSRETEPASSDKTLSASAWNATFKIKLLSFIP